MIKMKTLRLKSILTSLFAFILVTSVTIYSQNYSVEAIPNVIAFTSIIADNHGNNLPDGEYDITFKIYDAPDGGNLLWSEVYDQMPVKDGVVNILIGKKDNANNLNLRFDKKYFLAIGINDENESLKRIELGSSPYSLGSKFAHEVKDGAITNEKLAPNSITDDKIESISFTKFSDEDPDPLSIYWTIQGNIIYGPERNYIGTIEEKDFVVKTYSIERIRFDPYGRITMGTPSNNVEFTVIGKSKFRDVFIKGDLGVGVMPGAAKVHVNSDDRTPYTPPDMTPFLVDKDDVNIFKIGIDGRVEISSTVTGSDDNEANYAVSIDGVDHGIAVRVDGNATNDNNFVSFWDNSGMTGRIEGETVGEYLSDPTNIALDVYLVALGVADGIAIAAAPVEPASIMAFSAELIYNGVLIGLDIAGMGVTYESSSGDYAEWLQKINDNEEFAVGDVVGIYNGEITKNTEEADQLLCISLSPIVLGNQRPKENINSYEKVAFLGQVPVYVRGIVKLGDYIITSGLNDGSAIAVSPELMTIDEYLKIVGRAWQSSSIEEKKLINTSIGFNMQVVLKMLELKEKQNQNMLSDLDEKNKKINAVNNELKSLNERLSAHSEKFEILSAKILLNQKQKQQKVKIVSH